MPKFDSAEVRGAARRILDGKEPVGAYRVLIEALLPVIESGARRAGAAPMSAGSRSASDFLRPDVVEVSNRFLDEKLVTRRFLEALVASRDPFGETRVAARNFTVDVLRHRIEAQTPERARQEDGPTPGVVAAIESNPDLEMETGAPRGISPDEPLILVAEAERVRRALDRLSVEDQILVALRVGLEPSEAHIEHLARLRGIPVEDVAAEVGRREQRIDRDAANAAKDVARRSYAILRLHREIRRLRRIADACADPLLVAPAACSVERIHALRRSMRLLEGATPAERSACLSYLEDRLAAEVRRRNRAMAGRWEPREWDDIAHILGRLRPTSDEGRRATVVNTLTVRFARLRRRLAEALETEDHDD
ncbi:MAG: hypothetical protein QME96_17460 [Myxococcota bacterium]|nr:hypothetical protein [Myxococcota bacterium]